MYFLGRSKKVWMLQRLFWTPHCTVAGALVMVILKFVLFRFVLVLALVAARKRVKRMEPRTPAKKLPLNPQSKARGANAKKKLTAPRKHANYMKDCEKIGATKKHKRNTGQKYKRNYYSRARQRNEDDIFCFVLEVCSTKRST